ncbi:MAG: ATP-binding protein [Bacteroidales bacterium]|nr:ATP-binding protein [Bacteroidales bacterium]
MNKERLKEIILDQKEVFSVKSGLIERDIPLETYIKTSQIVVITGVRRCGKSSLLFLIKQRMQLSDSDYCYFNFDDERIPADVSVLDEIYKLHLEEYGKEPVLFLDEIQNVKNWEKFVNRMYEQDIKVYVTGSNANLLSSEISTSLTGRNKIIELFPFSFKEFLRLNSKDYELQRMTTKTKALIIKDFNSYLKFGGFPLVIKEQDLELINSYFQDILYRDIIARYHLSQVDEIKQIGLFFAANIGKIFSYTTLQKISGVKSLSSIKDYLFYYTQSYLFFYLKKFDFSVKKQIMSSKKVYSIDAGFANRIGFSFSKNKGRILENMVYLELLRRGKDVYYFAGKNECDFILKEGLKIVEAIQVSYRIDRDNEQWEYAGLIEAIQAYQIPESLILTYDFEDTIEINSTKIKILPVWKWLLSP